MLARTHGQTASPTTIGKELAVLRRPPATADRQMAGRGNPGQAQRRRRQLQRPPFRLSGCRLAGAAQKV